MDPQSGSGTLDRRVVKGPGGTAVILGTALFTGTVAGYSLNVPVDIPFILCPNICPRCPNLVHQPRGRIFALGEIAGFPVPKLLEKQERLLTGCPVDLG
jgi:hypothetical protein